MFVVFPVTGRDSYEMFQCLEDFTKFPVITMWTSVNLFLYLDENTSTFLKIIVTVKRTYRTLGTGILFSAVH